MNSIVQLLCTVPELSKRYGPATSGDVTDHKFFSGITPKAAPDDLLVQMAKLATALTSGAYALPTEELESEEPTNPKYRLAPRMFKHLVGKDHVDFKTAQQQDAAQFLQYLLEQVDRAELKKDRNLTKTSNIFSFGTQAKLVCSADQKIKYKENAPETIWSLRLPMDKTVVLPTHEEPEQKKQRQDGEEEKAIPTVKFSDCLDTWAAESSVDDYRWPHLQNAVHPASQTTRLQNFPRYLWVQIQRYELGPDWQPIKLEVNLDIPDELDLTEYRAKGPQECEELVPEVDESTPAPSEPEISEVALSMLMDMGFNMNGCKRALTAVGGSDTEAAMTWIFEHNMDPDFNDPLPESGGAPASSGSSGGVDDAVVMSLVESLGCFTIDQVRAALKETNGAADRAADWLFSHMVSHQSLRKCSCRSYSVLTSSLFPIPTRMIWMVPLPL
jgi:ubiquitin carboxyl-terminal hydrolase 5/13